MDFRQKLQEQRDAYRAYVLKQLLFVRDTQGEDAAYMTLEIAKLSGDLVSDYEYDLFRRAIEIY